MDFTDPIVRRVSQFALVLMACAFLVVSFLCAWLVFDWDGYGVRGELATNLFKRLPRLSGQQTSEYLSLASILFGAFPIAVASVCFTVSGTSRHLNGFGAFMVCALLMALIMSSIGYLWITPLWALGHPLDLEGLMHAQQWARTIVSACAFYLAALLGIKAKP